MTTNLKRVHVLVIGSGSFFESVSIGMQQQECRVINEGQLEDNKEKIDIVIDTANLDLEEKIKNLQHVEGYINEETVILSSSLGISATEMASHLKKPERLIGFGLFGSWQDAELIEVAPPLQADENYINKAVQYLQSCDKEVEIVQDEAGLVFPRILSLIINEATFALSEGIATRQEIDIAMKKGTNYPFGPLEWADRIGIDQVYAVLRSH